MADDSANDGQDDGDSRRRREEILHGQAQHLREVTHRGATGVILPIGIGGKADCSIECGSTWDATEM